MKLLSSLKNSISDLFTLCVEEVRQAHQPQRQLVAQAAMADRAEERRVAEDRYRETLLLHLG